MRRRPPLQRTVRGALVAALTGYIITLGVLWAGQDRMLFPGAHLRVHDDALRLRDTGLEVASVRSADGTDVRVGWRDAGADRAVLFLHGNGEVVSDHLYLATALADAGWSFAGMEFRGYGGAPGHPGERGLVDDAQAVFRWLVDARGLDPARIVVHGRSLGGGVVGAASLGLPAAGFVLESTFDSLAAVAAQAVPYAPVRLLIRHPMDSADALAGRAIPVLVLHGALDDVIPVSHAHALAARLAQPTVHMIPTLGHNPGLLRVSDTARAAYAAWLDAVVPRR